jgi:hypothetical protein
MMKTLDKIKQGLQAQKPALVARYKIKEIGIFGSYVRGQQQSKSDLDILVDFEEYPSLFEFVALEQELSDSLGVKVDLVMKSGLKPRLGQHILREVVYL